ncbi:MAG: AAA family ATPase [Candidatus Endonucleobacter sp. (ex Gigantidas childressi)]|nr:AAA family ATPase [Candidatus Endonucleobacter sp. (ex Gigantidas childressi)]
MRINQLKINNFRNFEKLTIDFDEKLTVIAAPNGSGKTTVLDAVRASLWAYVRKIDVAGGSSGSKAVGINIDDVTLLQSNNERVQMEPKLPSSIESQISVLDKTYRWKISREKVRRNTNTLYKDAKPIEKLASYLQERSRAIKQISIDELSPSSKKFIQDCHLNDAVLQTERPQDLPVLGFYGTGRLWKEKQYLPKGAQLDKSFFSRTYGYLNCLDEASSYKYFSQWFKWLFESHREEQIKAIEADIQLLETKQQPYIRAVQTAINKVVESKTGWRRIEYSTTQKSIVLYNKQNGILKLEQLSDGVRSAVALVADIAYRCVKLNGHMKENAALESEGIIMIDEVDMHLHPSWQQTIVGSLQQAFPKIQFILTTHSPQVLSTVDSKSIRILQQIEDPETGKDNFVAQVASTQSLGVASADVMALLQGVDPIPDVKQARWLTQYKQLITQDEHTNPTGSELKEKILAHFGETHQEWLECERLIRLQAMKAKLPKRNG